MMSDVNPSGWGVIAWILATVLAVANAILLATGGPLRARITTQLVVPVLLVFSVVAIIASSS